MEHRGPDDGMDDLEESLLVEREETSRAPAIAHWSRSCLLCWWRRRSFSAVPRHPPRDVARNDAEQSLVKRSAEVASQTASSIR